MARQSSKGKSKKGGKGAEGDEAAPLTRAQKWRGFFREVVFLGLLVLSVLSARSSLADHYYVPTGSMLPTVVEGDHLVVSKLAYGVRVPFTGFYLAEFDGPQAGDVVVLESPTDGTILLKRIIALPGDRVRVAHGRLEKNGQPMPILNLREVVNEETGARAMVGTEVLGEVKHDIRFVADGGPDLSPDIHGANATGVALVPEGLYLVMGDNRGESRDGRTFGWVRREAILGHAIAIYWRSGFEWRPL